MFKQIAVHASDYGILVYRFSPMQIQPETELIKGERYDPELKKWVSDTFPIPKYLYDRVYYGEDRISIQSRAILRWLKARDDLVFLGYGLPNKWVLYQKLSEFDSLSPYLPLTRKASSVVDIQNALLQYKKIVLKPANGAHGYGIYVISRIPNGVRIQTQKKNRVIEHVLSLNGAWIKWITQLIEGKDFLIQPYLRIQNDSNQPFDVRIFLQKDERGQWVERGRGVRVGIQEGIISNLSGGAAIKPYYEWLKELPHSKRDFIHQEIETIIESLPIHLENAFFPLFELGIDIGIARDYSVWLLDANSKPGRHVILHLFPELEETLANAPLRFTRFLHESSKPGRVKK
ncbi:YheC/YheD family protein [Bacillus oleivorans]|uniref:YheC/YheD family endospore coat-associated protein n=1 Tax=Bacillus oleivorans TaxID=1448271 RepID=UPI0015CA65CB|nr:YheC/YheD family protein [Bacillus oleivorans]